MLTIDIGRKDVLWNYAATFLRIGVGVILLPFILRAFPQETVAIWTIFSTIIALTSLLDFGFNPSFSRNVSYVISGVKELKEKGVQVIDNIDAKIDYGLLKGLINAMRWFYSRMSLILLLVLTTVGTYYIHTILKTYTGNHTEIYIAWFILCTVNTYSLYTYYYDALMQGMGMIKRIKQIDIVAYILYLTVAAVLIMLHFNLIAIVSAQALQVLIKRILSRQTIYTSQFRYHLNQYQPKARKEFIKPILPNAVKLGLTSLGGFLVNRSAVIIGALYLSLEFIASYGITIQIIAIITSISMVYFSTYQPRIVQLRVQNDKQGIRRLYFRSITMMFMTFAVLGIGVIFLGDWLLEVIKSKTPLLPKEMVLLALIVALLETNHSIAGGILLSKNEVPFFMASILGGIGTLILLLSLLSFTNIGVWSLITAQGMASIVYNNWKWPYEAYKSLK
ncbi:MAG: hypothetical protein LBR84_09205 [Tannerella sp.]|jgi:O-antigen/teichoic acid export membrane protein|nr:hypothetical protein [Tannerella sp.]